MNTRASVLATLNCYLMMLLWTVTEGSRFSTATQEVLNRSHQSAGDLRRNDSHSWFQGRYNQEYPHDSLHELMKAGTRKRYILSDYQDFSLSEAQHTLYKEYDNRVSHPGATVLLPRSREEREEDLTRRNRGGGKQNKSDAIQVDGEAVLITPSAVVDIGAPDTATEEAEDNTVTEDVNLQIRQIFNAEDLQKAGRPLCRSRENYLPPEFFSADSCALCYGYLQNKDFFHTKWLATDLLKTMTEGGRSYVYSVTVLFNPKNISQVEEAVATSEVLLETFSGEVGRAKWRSCCHAAVQCCENMLTASWPSSSCPNTWDGWQCWPATLPNTEINKPCPSYIYHGKGPSCAKEASKRCEEDGQWFRREGRHEWSNYSSCSVEENIHRRLHVHIAAYSISVAALFPALCIFFSYKQLRVHRITLHKHLFLSLLLEALGVIIFRLLQLYKNDLIQQNPAWCVTLNLLTKYTSVTNYMWYLCEGFYLHKLLVSAFAEQNNLTIFYLIGWGKSATGCCSMINIIFVVNIIRILVSKVRATTANEPSQYRKAVRATMMVVPLFGLQYIVTIYRHQVLGCDWQDLYQIFNNMIEGSTGAIVAIIFCYTNGEIGMYRQVSTDKYGQDQVGKSTCISTGMHV
nr:calcitonin gene-related peptide type 1 receptor-like [Cherax quadricarinatus]